MPAWLSYTLLRLGLFALALAAMLLIGLDPLWAALLATVISFCVSYIFLRSRRLALAEQWATRQPSRTRDDAAEDDELGRRAPDARRASGASGASGASSGDGERERRAES